MARRLRVTSPASVTVSAPLRVNDLKFITAYLDNGCDGKAAYLSVHPGVKGNSAEVGASRLLSQDKIKQEIAQRMQHDGGVTRQFVQSHLLRALHLAGDNPQTITTVCRELAELAGLKVQKVQDVTAPPSVSEEQLREALRVRGFAPVPVN